MSEDQNYQQQQIKPQEQVKFRTLEQVELTRVVHSILTQSQKSQPLFPTHLSKKLCESNGLQCTQDTFFNIMSNVIQYSLNDVLNYNKQIKSIGKYKKQGNDNQLKTLDIQKYFQAKNIHIAKPRCYPQIALEKDKKSQLGQKESINNQ